MDDQIQSLLGKRNKTVSIIKSLIIEILNYPLLEEDLDPDAPLFGTGIELDSIDAVELVVSVEKRFQIKFNKAVNIYYIRTINKIADAVYLAKENKQNESFK